MSKTQNKKLVSLTRVIFAILISLAICAAPALVSAVTTAETTPTGGAGSVIREIGGTTQLPSYDAGHASQNYQPGASKLTSTVYFILDFFKYIFGSIAVLMIVISGIKLILSARAVQDVMSREKETMSFAFSGLLIILLADTIIRNVFFGQEGEMYRTGTDLQMAAEQGVSVVQGVTGLIRVFIPSIAILFFVVAAYRLLVSQGDPEQLKKAQKQITWSIVGIIVAGLSEIVVFNVLFPQQGSRIPDANEFSRVVVTMTNYVSAFISTIAVSMLIYAGYLYVVSGGGEGINKAKTVIKGAIVGLLIAMAAFALVNTFVKVEPLSTTPVPEETTIPNT